MLYQALRDTADARPGSAAVRTAGGEEITYSQLAARTDRIAGGLHRAGIGAGCVVACAMDNSVGYVAFILAVARLGATYVPMMSEFGPADIARALNLTEPSLLVVDGSRPSLPGSVPTLTLAELERAEPLPDREERPYPGRFRLLWSSGSTGSAKMISWRQDALLAERRRWGRHIGLNSRDVFFCRHPLDVAHATDLHLFSALLCGGVLVLAEPQAPAAVLLRQLAETGATVMSALPRHYDELVRAADEAGGADLAMVRLPMCGGTYVSPDLIRAADRALNVRIRQLYGSTEFGLAAVNLADVVQTDATVSLVDGVDARLEVLSADSPEIGELVLRSAYTSDGYPNEPQAQARAFRDAEYWTGDVAARTGESSYRILGRVTEVLAATDGPLLTSILDEEIERRCPVTESVSIVSGPGQYTDVVAVVVTPRSDVPVDALERSVRDVLNAHGLRGTIHLVQTIPHTAVGKPHKSLIFCGVVVT